MMHEAPRQDRRVNLFWVGGSGLLLLVVGNVLSSWADELGLGNRMVWKLAGQLVFLVGLVVVVAAGIVWFRQAQGPEEAEAPLDEGPDPEYDQPSSEL